jgi:hypothetical protein
LQQDVNEAVFSGAGGSGYHKYRALEHFYKVIELEVA